jgi:hypothetical protein
MKQGSLKNEGQGCQTMNDSGLASITAGVNAALTSSITGSLNKGKASGVGVSDQTNNGG